MRFTNKTQRSIPAHGDIMGTPHNADYFREPKPGPDGFGERLRTLRLKKTMTQAALAASLSVNIESIRQWEHAVVLPTVLNLIDVAIFFGVGIETLLGTNTKSARKIIVDDPPRGRIFKIK